MVYKDTCFTVGMVFNRLQLSK